MFCLVKWAQTERGPGCWKCGRQYTLWFAYCVGLYSCKVVLGDCAFKPYYFELISNSLRSVQANIFDCSTFLVSFLFYCNCQSGNFTVHVCCQSFTFHFKSAFLPQQLSIRKLHSSCLLPVFYLSFRVSFFPQQLSIRKLHSSCLLPVFYLLLHYWLGLSETVGYHYGMHDDVKGETEVNLERVHD